MPKQSVAEHIVDTLYAIGVRRIFGVVGDSLNALTDALRRHYGRQLRRDPRFVQWMRDIGRSREVDMAA